jgi:hypothetical protein
LGITQSALNLKKYVNKFLEAFALSHFLF